jgi:threonine dehydratase
MIPTEWFHEAQERLKAHIDITPLTYDANLDAYMKWENHQITGSFKARGALNKILSLSTWEQERGFVAASAGNHGQGVALAARKVKAKAKIFVSEHAVPTKIHAMRKLGAVVILVRGGYGEAEAAGWAYAKDSAANWISPYNDGQVIAGQGTIAIELLKQNPALAGAVWIVPVGGGGLISGIGCVLASEAPQSLLIGVQSVASPYFHAIFKTGSQEHIAELPSLADGLAGPVESEAITIPIVQKTVKDILLVTEAEISHAVAYAWQHYQERIEGSAAVTLAAVLAGKIAQRPLVIILSGGNIQPEVHRQLVGD